MIKETIDVSKEQNTVELPENFSELKKSINRTANWEERIAAVNELAAYKTDETIKMLQYTAKADLVTKVRNAAAAVLKKWGVSVPAYEAPKGELIKDVKKVFLRIKKSLPADHTVADFKVKLGKMRSDIYNTYEGEMGDKFDAWLEEMWTNTITRK